MRISTFITALIFCTILFAQDLNQDINHSAPLRNDKYIEKVFEIDGELYGTIGFLNPNPGLGYAAPPVLPIFRLNEKMEIVQENEIKYDVSSNERIIEVIAFKNKVYVSFLKYDGKLKSTSSRYLREIDLKLLTLKSKKIVMNPSGWNYLQGMSENGLYASFYSGKNNRVSVYDEDFKLISEQDIPDFKNKLKREIVSWAVTNRGTVYVMFGRHIRSLGKKDREKISNDYFVFKIKANESLKKIQLNTSSTPNLFDGKLIVLKDESIAVALTSEETLNSEDQGVYMVILDSKNLDIISSSFSKLSESDLTHQPEGLMGKQEIDDLVKSNMMSIQKTSLGHFYVLFEMYKYSETATRIYVFKYLDDGTLEWTRHVKKYQSAWHKLIGANAMTNSEGALILIFNSSEDGVKTAVDDMPSIYSGYPLASVVTLYTIDVDGSMKKEAWNNMKFDNNDKSETHIMPSYCSRVINRNDLYAIPMFFAENRDKGQNAFTIIKGD